MALTKIRQEQGVVINEGSTDVDFRVESNGATYALFVDGGSNHVNVMTSTDLGGVLNVSGDLVVNNGATNVVAKFQSTDGTSAIQLADNAGNVELSAVGNSFTVNPAGGTSKLIVTNDGYVTMPSQPAFSVHKNSTDQSNFSTNTNITLTWTHSRFDQNSDFDFVNGRFTAPVTGKYQLSGNIRLDNIDNSADYYIVFLTTSNEVYRFIFDPDLDGDQNYWTVSINVLADMDANDVVSLQVNQGNGSAQTDINGDAEYTYFSGFLAC